VSDLLQAQRDVTRIALRALADTGFVLAGGSAVREHGITTRPTEDVDLFTSHPDADAFSAAVSMVIDALRDAGYQVSQTRTADQGSRAVACTAQRRTASTSALPAASTSPRMPRPPTSTGSRRRRGDQTPRSA